MEINGAIISQTLQRKIKASSEQSAQYCRHYLKLRHNMATVATEELKFNLHVNILMTTLF